MPGAAVRERAAGSCKQQQQSLAPAGYISHISTEIVLHFVLQVRSAINATRQLTLHQSSKAATAIKSSSRAATTMECSSRDASSSPKTSPSRQRLTKPWSELTPEEIQEKVRLVEEKHRAMALKMPAEQLDAEQR